MSKYIAVRLLQTIPVLLGISLLAFALIRLAPTDPVSMLVDLNTATPAQIAEARQAYGLNDALPVQYVRMLGGLVGGELRSIRTKEPTITMVLNALPTSLVLAFWSLLFGLVVGTALGVFSALRPYSLLDNILSVFGLIGISMPQFFFALILIVIVAENLGLLPAGGVRPLGSASTGNPLEGIRYWILPVTVSGLSVAAVYSRYARNGMLETLHHDFVRTARAKGLSEKRVIAGHALRNAMITLVTLTGVYVPILVGNTVIIESVFSLPGLGRLAVGAAVQADYPVVMTTTIVVTATVLLANLVTDLVYPVIDPRIRL